MCTISVDSTNYYCTFFFRSLPGLVLQVTVPHTILIKGATVCSQTWIIIRICYFDLPIILWRIYLVCRILLYIFVDICPICSFLSSVSILSRWFPFCSTRSPFFPIIISALLCIEDSILSSCSCLYTPLYCDLFQILGECDFLPAAFILFDWLSFDLYHMFIFKLYPSSFGMICNIKQKNDLQH